MNLSTFSGLITSCTCSTKLIFSPEVYQERRVILLYFAPFAPVAQLDRVPGYEPGGRGFKSCRARQTNQEVRKRGQAPLFHLSEISPSFLQCISTLSGFFSLNGVGFSQRRAKSWEPARIWVCSAWRWPSVSERGLLRFWPSP